MAGELAKKILSAIGIYEDPYYPSQDEAYDEEEDGYYNGAGYAEEAEYDGGTLNEQLRNQGGGRAGNTGAGAGGRSGPKSGAGAAGNVVNLHPQKPQNYVLVSAKPDRLEDAQLVCDHLKERHVVIVNVEGLDGREAQRIVDFIGGAVYALDGEIFDITNRIFAVAPNYVDLVSIQRDTKNRGFLSFGGNGGNSGNYNRG